MRVSWLKGVQANAPTDKRKLFDVDVIDGHNGSGRVILRRTLAATSFTEALGIALAAFAPGVGSFENGASVQVSSGHVWSGVYRNETTFAIVERPENTHNICLTESGGDPQWYESEVMLWEYLQDHHYQSVR